MQTRANGSPSAYDGRYPRPGEVLADVHSLKRKVILGVYAVVSLILPLYIALGYTATQVATAAALGWVLSGIVAQAVFAQIFKLRKREAYPSLLMLQLGDAATGAEAAQEAVDILRSVLGAERCFLTRLADGAHKVIAGHQMGQAEALEALQSQAERAVAALDIQHPMDCVVGEERLVFVPVVSLRKSTGLLYLAGRRSNGDLRDRKLLNSVGGALGLLLENLRQKEELLHKEARLRSVIDGAPVVLFSVDTAGTNTFFQGRGMERLGVDPETLLGRPIWDVYANYPEILQSFRRAFAGDNVTSVATITLENARAIFEYKLSPERDELGRVAGVIGIATDVTERRDAERALRESERTLETLVGNLPGFVYRCRNDRDWTMEYLSEGIEEITGYFASDLMTGVRQFSDIIHPDDREGVWEKVQHAVEARQDFQLEYRLVTASGGVVWIWEHGQAIYSEEGEVEALEGFVNDITERKRAADALVESERFLSTLISNLPGFVFRCATDESYTVQYVSEGIRDVLGLSPEELPGGDGLQFAELIHPEDRPRMWAAAGRCIAEGEPFEVEYRMKTKDGRELWLWEHAQGVLDSQGKLTAIEGFVTNVTVRRQAQQALTDSEARYRDLFENANDIIFTHNAEGRFHSINRKAEAAAGYSRDELLGRTVWDIVAPEYHEIAAEQARRLLAGEDPGPFEVEVVAQDGRRVPLEVSERALKDEAGEPYLIQGIARDISERKQAEETIRRLAYHDALTGLPNRALFEDRLSVSLAQARRGDQMLAVMFLDLDQFKVVNDTLGHGAGDRLLESVARDLLTIVREGDTVARVGGDEFTLLLPNIERTEDALEVSQRILDRLRQPRTLGGQEFRVTASMGITTFPADGRDAETLLRNADTAMYRAKERGRDNYQLYTPAMNERMMERLAFENDLRHALARGELTLYYQPIVDVATGKVTGAEALLRWRHPQRGVILPDEFIPFAEESGLIVEIGEHVLREAALQAKEWEQAGAGLGRIAVNLSARQLQQEDLVSRVQAVLRETGVSPKAIQLEITEGAVLKNVEYIVAMLVQLREMGVKISLDDFGTGYSSLTYLKRFPIDAVKIDRSFVRDLQDDASDAAIVSTVIAMAESLDLRVIAEGVETEEQLEFLRSRGCHEFQGFLFSCPVPAEEFLQAAGLTGMRSSSTNGRTPKAATARSRRTSRA